MIIVSEDTLISLTLRAGRGTDGAAFSGDDMFCGVVVVVVGFQIAGKLGADE